MDLALNGASHVHVSVIGYSTALLLQIIIDFYLYLKFLALSKFIGKFINIHDIKTV